MPRKAESEETPWYDRYDSEHGYVKYYGDNKPNKGRPENAPGNKIIHDKVYTTYTVFDAAGNRYVQIDTYGKIDRENPEKISQSIQFDKQTAEFFVTGHSPCGCLMSSRYSDYWGFFKRREIDTDCKG